MLSVECSVAWNVVACSVESKESGVFSEECCVGYEVGFVECEVLSVKCGVYTVECRV